MQVTLERPPEQSELFENKKSFDPLASVRLMRHDLQHYGEILPETLDRVCDEELSYLAEGVDKAARTTFALKRQGGDLVYFDKGQWQPYMNVLYRGRTTAYDEASKDPRREFLVDRAEEDLRMGYQMQKLRPGQRISWSSPYPYEVEGLYGKRFLSECGFQTDRKMGFLYQATCLEDGTLLLESQTVDRSDEDAFAFALDPEIQNAGLDAMVDTYDMVLGRKYSGIFYAGRLDSERNENVWREISAQKDLIEYLLTKLEELARSSHEGRELEHAVKRHIYGVWAAFKNRLDGNAPRYSQHSSAYGFSAVYNQAVVMEVYAAFRQFASEGRVLTGCGGSINMLQGEENIMNADSKDVFDAIFGEKSDKSEDSKLPALIKCINCKEKVPSKEVVKEKSWCCPRCKYEVDVCDGRVICAGVKK